MAVTEAFYDILVGALTAGKLALYTAAPTADDGGEEVTGGGYARMTVALSQDNANPQITKNSTDVSFSNLPECDVVAVALWDIGNTNMLAFANIPTKHFEAGDTGTLAAGLFSVTFN